MIIVVVAVVAVIVVVMVAVVAVVAVVVVVVIVVIIVIIIIVCMGIWLFVRLDLVSISFESRFYLHNLPVVTYPSKLKA